MDGAVSPAGTSAATVATGPPARGEAGDPAGGLASARAGDTAGRAPAPAVRVEGRVDGEAGVLFFGLNTAVLAILLAAVMVAATLTGLFIGRRMGRSSTAPREHFGVLQGALIGFMGLVLAFGLSLALGRYESRRADTVDEANAIGTAYLRAQTLAEPMRSESLDLFPRYTATSIRIADVVPGSVAEERARTSSARDQD